MPSLGSSPSRGPLQHRPASRIPTRLLSAVTSYGADEQRARARRVNQSARGPGTTRSDDVAGRGHADRRHVDAGDRPRGDADRAGARRRRAGPARGRPACRWNASPAPVRRRSRPAPRGSCAARTAGRPRRSSRRRARTRRRTATPAARRPCIGQGAPVSATVTPPCARTASPPKVTSSAAAPSGLPSSRLASRSEPRSAAPDRPTPRAAKPGPAEVLDGGQRAGGDAPRASGRPSGLHEPDADPGQQQGRRVAVEVPGRRAVWPISCQPPGDSRG